MLNRPRQWLWLAVPALVFGLAALPSSGAIPRVSLRLRADPDRLPADGKSQAVITVEATDARGLPVPDGSAVYLFTTLGQVVSPVQTMGGLAQTVLTASNVAGVALVSALVGPSRGTLQVEFLAQPGSAAPGSRLVEIQAEEVSYSADRRVFIAGGSGELRYQQLGLAADGLQYDMDRSVVCAQGKVALRAGDRTVSADALRYDLITMQGRLLRVGEEVERLVVEGNELELRPDTEEKDWLWDPLQTGDTRTWVKARRAIIDPGRKIVLDHATFYVDNARVMSLRRSVLDPAMGTALFGQALGYSSASGMKLDLPWYYRASGSQIGSLHLTRNRAMNGNESDAGWALGLQEEYFREGSIEGSLLLDDLTDPRRGMRWEHRQHLGGRAQLSLDGSAFTFDEDSPRFRARSIGYSRPVSSGSLWLTFSRTNFGQSEEYHSDLTYRFASRRLGSGVAVTPSAHLRQWRVDNESQDVLIDTRTGEPLLLQQQQTGRTSSGGVDLNITPPTLNLGPDTKLSTNLTTGWYKVFAGGSRGLLDGRLSLDHSFDPRNNAALSYSFSSNPAAAQGSIFSQPRHMLGLSASLQFKGTSLQASASQELGGSRRYGSLHLARPLPFGTDGLGRHLWSLELSHFFTVVDQYEADRTRLSLTRLIGRYRASLCYSPQGVGDFDSRPWVSAAGYGYTYSGGRHLWLELSAWSQ